MTALILTLFGLALAYWYDRNLGFVLTVVLGALAFWVMLAWVIWEVLVWGLS